jgi:hypothetical protein
MLVASARRCVLLCALVSIAVGALALPAFAGTAITQPTGNPYHMALFANGKPQTFAIVASGFQLREPVYVEQCDGRLPSAPNWSPTNDCDFATGNAPVYADATGVARFGATDPSTAFRPFIGTSPQQLFNCVKPGDKAPPGGLPTFDNCQLRVASSVTKATDDQVFLPLAYGGASASAGGSGSSSVLLWVILGVLIVAAVVGGAIWWMHRRHAATPSPPPRERSAPRR